MPDTDDGYDRIEATYMGRKLGGRTSHCPVTEDVCDRLVRLPFYNTLDEADQMRVIGAVLER